MDSKAAKAAVKAGKAAIDAKDWLEAIRQLRPVVGEAFAASEVKPDTLIKGLLFAAFAHSKLKEWGESIRCFEQTLELDPSSVHARQGLADALLDRGVPSDQARAVELLEGLLSEAKEKGDTKRVDSLTAKLEKSRDLLSGELGASAEPDVWAFAEEEASSVVTRLFDGESSVDFDKVGVVKSLEDWEAAVESLGTIFSRVPSAAPLLAPTGSLIEAILHASTASDDVSAPVKARLVAVLASKALKRVLDTPRSVREDPAEMCLALLAFGMLTSPIAWPMVALMSSPRSSSARRVCSIADLQSACDTITASLSIGVGTLEWMDPSRLPNIACIMSKAVYRVKALHGWNRVCDGGRTAMAIELAPMRVHSSFASVCHGIDGFVYFVHLCAMASHLVRNASPKDQEADAARCRALVIDSASDAVHTVLALAPWAALHAQFCVLRCLPCPPQVLAWLLEAAEQEHLEAYRMLVGTLAAWSMARSAGITLDTCHPAERAWTSAALSSVRGLTSSVLAMPEALLAASSIGDTHSQGVSFCASCSLYLQLCVSAAEECADSDRWARDAFARVHTSSALDSGIPPAESVVSLSTGVAPESAKAARDGASVARSTLAFHGLATLLSSAPESLWGIAPCLDRMWPGSFQQDAFATFQAYQAWFVLGGLRWVQSLGATIDSKTVQRGLLSGAKLDPSRTEAFVVLGHSFFEQGAFERAAQCFGKAADVEPSHPTAHLLRIDVFVHASLPTQALAAAREACEVHVREPWAWIRRAELARRQGEARAETADDAALTESMKSYQRYLREVPQCYRGWIGLTEVYLSLGRLSASHKSACNAVRLSLEPRSTATPRDRARALRVLSMVQASLAEFHQSVIASEESLLYQPLSQDACFQTAASCLSCALERFEQGNALAAAELLRVARVYARCACRLGSFHEALAEATERVAAREKRRWLASQGNDEDKRIHQFGLEGSHWASRHVGGLPAALAVRAKEVVTAHGHSLSVASHEWWLSGDTDHSIAPECAWKLLSDVCCAAWQICPAVYGPRARAAACRGATTTHALWHCTDSKPDEDAAQRGLLGPRAQASVNKLSSAAEEGVAAASMAVLSTGSKDSEALLDLGRALLLQVLSVRSALGLAGLDHGSAPTALDLAEAACRALRKSIHLDPSNAAAWTALGMVEPRPLVAQRAFAKAVELSGSGTPLCALGLLYARMGLVSLSRQVLVQAQAADPDNVAMWAGHGALGERSTNPKLAERSSAAYWSAVTLSLQPGVSVPAAIVGLGLTALRECYDNRLTPQSSRVSQIVATGADPPSLVDSMFLLRSAAETDPCNPLTLLALAVAEESAGRLDRAVLWGEAAFRRLEIASEAGLSAHRAMLCMQVNLARWLALIAAGGAADDELARGAARAKAKRCLALLDQARSAPVAPTTENWAGETGWADTAGHPTALEPESHPVVLATRALAHAVLGEWDRAAASATGPACQLRLLRALTLWTGGDAAAGAAVTAPMLDEFPGHSQVAQVHFLITRELPTEASRVLNSLSVETGVVDHELVTPWLTKSSEALLDAYLWRNLEIMAQLQGGCKELKRALLRNPSSATLWRVLSAETLAGREYAAARCAQNAEVVEASLLSERASLRSDVIDSHTVELLGVSSAVTMASTDPALPRDAMQAGIGGATWMRGGEEQQAIAHCVALVAGALGSTDAVREAKRFVLRYPHSTGLRRALTIARSAMGGSGTHPIVELLRLSSEAIAGTATEQQVLDAVCSILSPPPSSRADMDVLVQLLAKNESLRFALAVVARLRVKAASGDGSREESQLPARLLQGHARSLRSVLAQAFKVPDLATASQPIDCVARNRPSARLHKEELREWRAARGGNAPAKRLEALLGAAADTIAAGDDDDDADDDE
jgi:tetratricopeptide (TPR) repeat protein